MNQTKNDRVKIVREHYNLKQDEFAESIGITQGTLSGIENNKVTLSKQNFLAICGTYDINKEWLETGKGDMKLVLSRNERYAKAVNEIFKDEDPFIANMIIEVSQWPSEEKRKMKEALQLLKKITSI